MRQVLWALQLFIVLAAVWVALNGLTGWVVGLLAAGAGAAVGTVLVPADPYRWRPVRFAAFIGYFIIESVRGGTDVAVRALSPSLPVSPSFVQHESTLPVGQPLTLFVSVLSLLPGTLSAEVDDARGTVVVHLLVPSAQPGIGRLEQKIRWLFAL